MAMASGKGTCKAAAAAVLLALLGVNALYWWRWAATRSAMAHLVGGTCVLEQRDVLEAGLKELWRVPLVGPKWTDVPCKVNVTIRAADGSRVETADGGTWITFIYEQGIFANVFTDTCKRIVPKSEASFHCSYAGAGLPLVGTWGGQAIAAPVIKLPPMVTLLLMKAAGLSLMTLGPLSLMLVCWTKNALLGKKSGVSARSPEPSGGYAPLPDEHGTPEAF